MSRLLAVALVLTGPATALAYPSGAQFDADAVTLDGGGHVAFTGAPRFAGHTCEVCHTDAPGRIGVRIEAEPPWLFSDGYSPGETYWLRVVMTGEWLSADLASARDACGTGEGDAYLPCDDNGFALEIDAGGEPLRGAFRSLRDGPDCDAGADDLGQDVRVLDDCSGVTNLGHHGRTRWDFFWRAPDDDVGPLALYVAAVDGNSGEGTAENPNDTVGDDVFAGVLPILAWGNDRPPTQRGGCSAMPAAAARELWMVPAVLAIALLVRRRRSLAVALAGLLAVLSGCATVKPWQREKLAKPIMKFSPDSDENELDQHRTESREGSAGGYGSAGGGCGCN